MLKKAAPESVRATQPFRFVNGIAYSATEGQTIRLPSFCAVIVSDDVISLQHQQKTFKQLLHPLERFLLKIQYSDPE
ncbi:hypothetical protein [Paenibacillus sp. FSL H7-0331]|uniref:hypothetical protein n=1 Tax=Paenibacillus sp. FSL H7-0331 TaxID=1920421 RepID=UPI00096E1978|nr:hypothetical protein [Paenibacillus sp. FSL H7-0331]OMF02686.1 hypothetical protein BK127_36925 [Paenibacillus sp. FSL H7-0331]